MKRALEWSIRIFWGYFGLVSIYAVIEIAQYRLFHHHPPTDWPAALFLLMMAFLFAAIIFTAYYAVFRFSLVVVKPSVFVVSLILWMIVITADRTHVQPWIDHAPPNLFILLPELLVFPLSIVAAVAFYRVTSAILVKVLFPELSHSASRIL
jgi:hypothetical protein